MSLKGSVIVAAISIAATSCSATSNFGTREISTGCTVLTDNGELFSKWNPIRNRTETYGTYGCPDELPDTSIKILKMKTVVGNGGYGRATYLTKEMKEETLIIRQNYNVAVPRKYTARQLGD